MYNTCDNTVFNLKLSMKCSVDKYNDIRKFTSTSNLLF